MTRQAYIFEKEKISIFWTPKGACTTIVDILCFTVLGKDREELEKHPGFARGWLNSSEFSYSGRKAMEKTIKDGYKSIGLIRDPYDRLVSAYLNKFVSYHGEPILKLDQLEPFARNFYLGIFPDAEDDTYNGLTFKEFVTEIHKKIMGRPKGSEPNLDHHWNTQIPFYARELDFSFDELYNLKESRFFFKSLSETFGLDIKDKKSNVTAYSSTPGPNLTGVKSIDIAKRGDFSKSQFRDSTTIPMVKECFEIDYDYFQNRNNKLAKLEQKVG